MMPFIMNVFKYNFYEIIFIVTIELLYYHGELMVRLQHTFCVVVSYNLVPLLPLICG